MLNSDTRLVVGRVRQGSEGSLVEPSAYCSLVPRPPLFSVVRFVFNTEAKERHKLGEACMGTRSKKKVVEYTKL